MKRYIKSSTQIEYDNEGNVVPADIAAALKSSKIRTRDGRLIVCYHGTSNEFDEFKDEFISQNSGNIGWFGKGIYFSDSQKLSQSYGSNLKRAYLNITNPFIYSSPDSIYTLLMLGVSPRVYNERLAPFAYLGDETPIEEFTSAVKDAGYDGVKFSYRQGRYRSNVSGTSNACEFVCFSPNQIFLLK